MNKDALKLEEDREEMFIKICSWLNKNRGYRGGLFDCGALGCCYIAWNAERSQWGSVWYILEQLPIDVLRSFWQ